MRPWLLMFLLGCAPVPEKSLWEPPPDPPYRPVHVLWVDQWAVLRSGPGEEFPEVTRLSGGTVLLCVDKGGDWYRVHFVDVIGVYWTLASDPRGWIHRSDVREIPLEMPQGVEE